MHLLVNSLVSFIFWVFLTLPVLASESDFSFGAQMIDAADKGNEYVVASLLRGGKSVNVRGRFGVTPLMRAAMKGHKPMVRMLLESGANPNIKDVGGATALHLAARSGKTEIVKMLISHGAYMDAVDLQSYTPLMRSINKGDLGSVQFMVKKGANLDLTNKHSSSARQMIHDSNSKAMKKLIAGKSSELETKSLDIGKGAVKDNGVVIKENTLGKLKPEEARVEKLEYKEQVVRGDYVKDLNSYVKNPGNSMIKDEYVYDHDHEDDDVVDEILADNNSVRVAEAIKLPNEMDMSDPENKMVVHDTVRNLDDSGRWGSSESSKMSVPYVAKEYWMEISGFDSESEALNFWQKAARDANFKRLDAKLLDKNGPNMGKALRFGKFKSSGDVFHKCKLAKKLNSKVICYVLNDAY